jgi:hypothetical protein
MKAGYTTFFVLLWICNLFAALSPERFEPYLGIQWYGIYMQDKKVGYASISLIKQDTNRWLLGSDLRLRLMMQQAEAEIISIDQRVYAGDSAHLISNKMINRSDMGDITVTGKFSGQDYEIELEIIGHKQKHSFDYPLESLDDQMAITFKATDKDLKIDDNFIQEIFVFDPTILGKLKHIIKLVDKRQMQFSGITGEVCGFRDSIPSMRIAGTSYFDLNGNMLLQEFP